MRPITNYGEVSEALRSKALSSDCGGPGDQYRFGGTVLRLDGEAHRLRRQAIGELVFRGGHEWFRNTVLVPTVRRELETLLAGTDVGGVKRVDLRRWIHLINTQLAAAFVGLDRGRSMAGAAELLALDKRVMQGFGNALLQTMGGFDEAQLADHDGIRAIAEWAEKFYAPARARREELVMQVDTGELDESELPKDMITLFVKLRDPAWADPDLCVREAVFMMNATVLTTAETTLKAIGDLFAWFDAHPEGWPQRFDGAFLQSAVNESLRIHPFPAAIPRLAKTDLELEAGTRVHAGDLPMIFFGSADIDPDVFGPDAREFNPYRDVPKGTPPYGLAFGAGPHMCLGAPIVVGQKGIEGNVVILLRALFEAGIERDPDNPAPRIHESRGVATTHQEVLEPYPMMFRPVASTRDAKEQPAHAGP